MRKVAPVESHKVIPGKVSQSRAGLGAKSANRRLHQHLNGPFEAIEWPLEAQTAKNVYDLSIEFAQMSFRGNNLSSLPNRAVRLFETIGRYDFTRLNTPNLLASGAQGAVTQQGRKTGPDIRPERAGVNKPPHLGGFHLRGSDQHERFIQWKRGVHTATVEHRTGASSSRYPPVVGRCQDS